jgi:hypothetical protein
MVCAQYNVNAALESRTPIEPGSVMITAGSSHLYDVNFDDALRVVNSRGTRQSPESPTNLYEGPPTVVLHVLDILRHSKPGDIYRWWEA